MRVSWLKSKSGSSSHTDGSVQGRAALSTLWLSISRPRRGVTPPPHLQICTVDSKYALTLKFFLLLVYGLVPPVTCDLCLMPSVVNPPCFIPVPSRKKVPDPTGSGFTTLLMTFRVVFYSFWTRISAKPNQWKQLPNQTLSFYRKLS